MAGRQEGDGGTMRSVGVAHVITGSMEGRWAVDAT